ncbi:GDYXXLXY domain-containing protein [Halomonas sp. C22]|uniref:GDYXXLXY domain-containing protein n=1 Tax=Halomonas sp. C22 TaxID=2580567 RepID=UPI0016430B61|nr:GDYXXLXY domain-containing protein [Halomonas sp. C22]
MPSRVDEQNPLSYPTSADWHQLFMRLLPWLACLALAGALLFFVAYHWVGMGRWARLGLLQAVLLLAVGMALWQARRPRGRQLALCMAVCVVGALLALIGQVYQTGADPWQLFAGWAVLALPWVVMARLSGLWLLWWGLVNMAVWLYASVWGLWGALGWPQVAGLWGLAVVNSVALAGWEWGVQRRGWPAGWALRVLALGSGVPVTLLMMHWLSGALTHAYLPVAVYGTWLALLYGVYRYLRLELFMLAGGCLSVMVLVLWLMARYWLSSDGYAIGLLMMAIAVTAMGMSSVAWLKRMAGEGPLPWLLRGVQAVAGWLAALCLLGFVATLLVAVIDSGPLTLMMGLGCLGLGFIVLRKMRSHDVMTHLALVFSLTGQFLVAWALLASSWGAGSEGGWNSGWNGVWNGIWKSVWLLWMLQVGLAVVMPSALHRFVATLLACIALYMALALHGMGAAASGLILLAVVSVWHGYSCGRGHPEAMHAWGLGLLMGLLAVQGVLYALAPSGLDSLLGTAPRWPGLVRGVTTLLAGGALLWVVHRALTACAVPPASRRLAYAAVLVTAGVAFYVPGLSAGLALLLLGYALGQRLVLGAGVVLWLMALGHYYYWLDLSLLAKSGLLLLLGIAALRARGLLARRAHEADSRLQERRARASRFRWALVLSTLLVLAAVNVAIWQKERHLAEGEIVYLALAPVDPRSLMQGDYMALDFALAQRLRQALYEDHSQALPDALNGEVVVRLDDAQVARFQRLDDGSPLASDERRLAFRLRHGQVRFATDAFFFQEGHAERYEAARYGQFRVNAQGALLLTGLYDEALQRLGELAP